uniref:Uncharacterized protein n=1 Tax=Sphaerodactylus townsendi TaxID=933632 RepID=A0ACB8EJK5_9SAUR
MLLTVLPQPFPPGTYQGHPFQTPFILFQLDVMNYLPNSTVCAPDFWTSMYSLESVTGERFGPPLLMREDRAMSWEQLQQSILGKMRYLMRREAQVQKSRHDVEGRVHLHQPWTVTKSQTFDPLLQTKYPKGTND